MNWAKFVVSVVLCLLMSQHGSAQTVDEYVQRAEDEDHAGDIEAALQVMEKAVDQFPSDPTAHAWLGWYLGQSAGQSDDMMVQAMRSGKAFEHLDKAVALDSLHVYARFFRGLMGVMVPPFLGRLDEGIGDLNRVLDIVSTDPQKVSEKTVTMAYNYLGHGYLKKGDKGEARTAWEKVIQMAPDSDEARQAHSHLEGLSAETSQEPFKREGESETLRADLAAAREHLEKGEAETAVEILEKVVAVDTTDAVALAWLGVAYASLAGEGYDERIADDTDLRTHYAFEGYQKVDEAVAMAPGDPDVRFLRGMLGAQLPAFMGKTDQAIDDLHRVIETTPSSDLKTQALYSLGLAYRRKGLSVWEDLITRYPEAEATRMAFHAMRPEEKWLDVSVQSGPLVVVRFAIGFETELQPQTAVWVEDSQGIFVKTLYVSGFSGHVGSVQVVLSEWAEASHFETDATTGASIAAGWHLYFWDLTDHDGNRLPDGTYTVNVEVHHWPSMEYQLASAPIEVGGQERVSKVRAGDLIPVLEIRYVPE